MTIVQNAPVKKKPSRGFTLIESLVAAVIVALSVIMIVAVVRKGREIDVNDLHRRTARAIINAKLESRQYSYSNFLNLSAGSSFPAETDTLDDRHDGGTVPLTGTLTVYVKDSSVTAKDGVTNIPIKKIRMKMLWSEREFPDSIIIEKCVANIL
jgi:type II secretory pathway pseudopilin PulG